MNEFADTVTSSMSDLFPQDPPRFLARTPHGRYDPDVYRSELTAAGWSPIGVDLVEADSFAESAAVPAIAYCQGTPLRNEIVARNPPTLEEATARAAASVRRHFGAGRVQGRISAYVVTAERTTAGEQRCRRSDGPADIEGRTLAAAPRSGEVDRADRGAAIGRSGYRRLAWRRLSPRR